MDYIQSLNWRYATKKFDSSKIVEQETINRLIEAVRLTPTSYGLQLMQLVIVENSELKSKLVEYSWGQEQVKDCSHLFVFCVPAKFTVDHIENYISRISKERSIDESYLENFKEMMMQLLLWPKEKQRDWMSKQAYIALGNLLTVASIEKVDACPMEGFLPQSYSDILKLNEHNLEPILVVPVGYRADDDKNATMKKVRLTKEELLLEIK